MISKIRKMLLIVAASVALAVPAAVSGTAFAAVDNNDIRDGLCNGTNFDAGGSANCDDGADATGQVNDILEDIINIISLVVGVVAVIMIIFGGFKYITSGGDSSNVSGAKNTIIYALVGLVIVALAQFIVQFVLTKATTTP